MTTVWLHGRGRLNAGSGDYGFALSYKGYSRRRYKANDEGC